MRHIYKKTYCRLEEISDMDRNLREVPEYQFEELIYLKSTKAGYYQGVNVDKLKDMAETLKTNIVVIPVKGQYVLPNENLLGLTRKVEDEEHEALGNWFLFSYSDDVSNNYILGLQQIMEVGVKAMSPGINDPGTAIITLDYLSELLSMRMRIGDVEVVANEDSPYVVQLSTINFDKLLYDILSGYRQYSKHDVNIVSKLILILKYLKSQPHDHDSYLKSIERQLEIVKEDYEKSITNSIDKEMLDRMFESSYFNLRTG